MDTSGGNKGGEGVTSSTPVPSGTPHPFHRTTRLPSSNGSAPHDNSHPSNAIQGTCYQWYGMQKFPCGCLTSASGTKSALPCVTRLCTDVGNVPEANRLSLSGTSYADQLTSLAIRRWHRLLQLSILLRDGELEHTQGTHRESVHSGTTDDEGKYLPTAVPPARQTPWLSERDMRAICHRSACCPFGQRRCHDVLRRVRGRC